MSGALPAPGIRRAPRDLPSLPVLRARLRRFPSVVLPILRRPRTLAESVAPFCLWLEGVRGRTASTARAYRFDLEDFTAFCERAGVTMPGDVRHQLIEFYLAWLQTRGTRRRETAARRLAAIRGLYRYLVREEEVTRDPAAIAFGPKCPPRPLPQYLSVPEQERVLAALAADDTLTGRRDHALVATGLLGGLRCGELCDLRLEALDLEAGTLRVVRGKGGKDRELPVIPRLAAILRLYLADTRPVLVRAAPSPFVFVRAHTPTGPAYGKARAGLPLERRTIYRLIRLRVSPLVGRPVHPHMLRHSFASRLRAAGADLGLIQELLGHSEIGTTMIYAHLSTPQRREAVARLLGGDSPAPADAEPVSAVAPAAPPTPGLGRHRTARTHGPYGAIGQRVTALRVRLGLTRAVFARKVGVGVITLWRLESGKGLPHAATLRRIAELGGVSLDALLTSENGGPHADP